MGTIVQNRWRLCLRVLAVLLAAGGGAGAQATATSLADQPIYTTASVPGNVALTLSVEYPTATSIGNGILAYSSSKKYVGYFDPTRCYYYNQVSTKTSSPYYGSYFSPAALSSTTDYSCANASTQYLWSGNFLNWATHSTIDPFRWALTGGYRSVDTSSLTILEKAWSGTQASSSESPAQTTSQSSYANITPFTGWSNITTTIYHLGQYMCFTGTGTVSSGTLDAAPLSTGSITAAGSGYTNGTYTGVSLTGGTGSGAVATIVVSGTSTHKVTAVTITSGGAGYVVNDALSVGSGTLGSSGSGFSYKVTAVGSAVSYSNSSTNWSGTLTNGTEYSSGTTVPASAVDCVEVRVKVCDPSATTGVEANCTAYSSGNYKPEGLIQANAQAMRFADFGYLLDSASSSSVGVRDGGVMRARMEYVGPMMPVPGASAVTNPNAEWSATTGVFVANPDSTDVTNTQSAAGCSGGLCTIPNSGVVNYINMFGEHARSLGHSAAYKGLDNVSELYYTALRYYKELGNVPEYTALNSYNTDLASSDCVTASADQCVDGFPVVTNWYPADSSAPRGYDFPVQYSCQKNFILGIGDANTHQDGNLPGTYAGGGAYLSHPGVDSTYEPPLEALVSSTGGVACTSPSTTACSDTTVDTTAVTNWIGNQEGTVNGKSVATTGLLGQTALQTYINCCGGATFSIAGLAYDAHVKDILPNAFQVGGSKSQIQTITTYWVDVLEYGTFYNQNQYWMAAKYGGFQVPSGYTEFCSPVSGAACTATTAWPVSLWATQARTVTNGTTAYTVPDNYYSGRDAGAMVTGLTSAFAQIAAAGTSSTSSGLSITTSKVNASNNINFSASYDPSDWTGEVQANNLSFDSNGIATVGSTIWSARSNLAAQLAAGTYLTARRIVTWNDSSASAVPFLSANLSSTEVTDLTPSTSTATIDQVVAYLRGDQTNEGLNGAALFRIRDSVLGDIVDSQVVPLGPPAEVITSLYNPGYEAFQTKYASRKVVVYVGSNDGMLHAFDGSTTGSTAGQELWAYIPGALYGGPTGTPSVNGLVSRTYKTFQHYNMVNATPVTADVDFDNAGGSFSTTAQDWHTLLIGGLGKGGMSYFAIDVTDPTAMTTEANVAGKVLWEFNQNTITAAGYTATIGYSYGQALVTKTVKYGWVVIVSSGYDNSDGHGYIFLLNPKTGALLEPPISTGTSVGSSTSPSGLTHLTTFVPNYADGTSDALYAGDLLGNVWRVDLTPATGNYAAPLLLATVADSTGVGQSITTWPMPEVSPTTSKRYVVLGTGRTLASTDLTNTQINTIYSIWDGVGTAGGFLKSAGLPSGVTFPITRSELQVVTDLTVGIPSTLTGGPMGWYFDLNSATSGNSSEQVDVQPTADLGTALFGVNVSGGSICSPSGSGRAIWVNIDTGLTELTSSTGSLLGSEQLGNRIINVTLVNNGGTSIQGEVSTSAPLQQNTPQSNSNTCTLCGTGPPSTSASPATLLNWREIKGGN